MGTAFLYSFPFFVFVDTSALPTLKEVTVDKVRVRFYPLFRSGVANFIPMPPIKPQQIPFAPDVKVSFSAESVFPTLAVIPKLGLSEKGKASICYMLSHEWPKPLQEFPMDSLRVDVFGTDKEKAENISNKLVLDFLKLLRCKSRQWWIEHAAPVGNLRGRFPVLENSKPVGEQPEPRCKMFTACGDERVVDNELWQSTLTELERGLVAPFYELLTLDARYFAITSNIPLSVLNAALACEQARDVHFERLWHLKARGLHYKPGRIIRGNHLPVHLSSDLLRLTGNMHSYKKESPAEFAIIENLWDARGNVAHGRSVQYIEDGSLYVVDERKAMEFVKTVEHCLRWLENL